jgi:hypothetical protein
VQCGRDQWWGRWGLGKAGCPWLPQWLEVFLPSLAASEPSCSPEPPDPTAVGGPLPTYIPILLAAELGREAQRPPNLMPLPGKMRRIISWTPVAPCPSSLESPFPFREERALVFCFCFLAVLGINLGPYALASALPLSYTPSPAFIEGFRE